MKKLTNSLFVFIALAITSIFPFSVQAKLTVGVTLHPYYSYVSRIVEDRAVVQPLIEAGFNPHAYKLSPADLTRLQSMEAIVVNGIGHDEFAIEVLNRLELPDLEVVYANESVPLIGNKSGTKHNPHTFVSIDAAIRQIYTIARKLASLDPENGKFYQQNALKYARELRMMKRVVQQDLSGLDISNVRVASTHNAYGYLLQEFGLTVSAVVEPAHGVSPSAAQLQATIEKIRKANVDILFTELNMPNQYVRVIEKETGVKLYHFSHMTYGDYRTELVAEDMQYNLNTLSEAFKFAVGNDDE
ncbi:metal ABC transporter solute-binding protein, Zn/Mn family [Alkalimarinus alittae]|uniref:High-affinity zinc uptake system protein ZnuA n=1 Tax=Alkalimarinus alittae TaxID=2961619 RepID=A0ABY6N4R5_9ALTE|nr:zinc ABC transporter substrate-binding protein [Alkalimarinus alittae]UZE97079.1 zinc ABC transporter substrate-binding protein [Alkalimarinus alittae]